VLDAVVAVVKQQGVRPMSCREGEFKVGTVTVKVFNVLFDTGALHKSYVSSDLVEKHRDSWKEFILPHRAVARLADQRTKIETSEIIRGELSFVADDGETHYTGFVEAIVWTMPGMDFIVGLPDIDFNVAVGWRCAFQFRNRYERGRHPPLERWRS